MGDNVDIDQQAEAARQQTVNTRAQVEQVFGLTGGELMDVAWEPNYRTGGSALFNTATWGTFTFTYWYQGAPPYVERSYSDSPIRPGATYRTVCEDETFGQVPETVTDDQGTWKVVARYRSSGECECPNDDPTSDKASCPLCEETGEHSYIYIGDGWAEIVYRLEVATAYVDTSEKHSPSVGNSADSAS